MKNFVINQEWQWEEIITVEWVEITRYKAKDNIFAIISHNEPWKWVYLKRIWVWEELRRNGYARRIIELLSHKYWKVSWKIVPISKDMEYSNLVQFYRNIWADISCWEFEFDIKKDFKYIT